MSFGLETLPSGVALTLWSGQGLPHALDASRTVLAAVQPQMVQLHAGPQGLLDHVAPIAAAVRRLVPGVALLVGVAWDGWIENYARETARKQVEIEALYLRAVMAAHRAGALLVVINSEAAGKQYPEAARLFGARMIDTIRANCPGLLLGHTAYDHPHFHPEERNHGAAIDADDEGYPWSVYYGGDRARGVEGLVLPASGPVDVAMEQVYAAPAKGADGVVPMADAGALERRMRSSAASFRRAESLGWIDPTVPHLPYWQIHHVPRVSIAGQGALVPRVACWASPTRLDGDGLAGAQVLARAAARRLTLQTDEGLRRPTVAWAQARLGVTIDGVDGPKTRAAVARAQVELGLASTGDLTDETLVALAANGV